LRVRAYRNLHKKLWSVLYKGKVRDRLISLVLSSAKFVVLPGGLARCRALGHKTVHAFVEGDVLESFFAEKASIEGLEWVRYTPQRGEFFLVRNAEKVVTAEKVVLTSTGSCWALNPS
jgi:hypothetical protein